MEEALGQRLRADATFYNAGLSAVSLRWTWTLELLARMLRADMAPDSFTMNSALSGLVRGDQWRVAVQVMEEMESMRVRADIITFNTLLNAARWHKLEDVVFECFWVVLMDFESNWPNMSSRRWLCHGRDGSSGWWFGLHCQLQAHRTSLHCPCYQFYGYVVRYELEYWNPCARMNTRASHSQNWFARRPIDPLNADSAAPSWNKQGQASKPFLCHSRSGSPFSAVRLAPVFPSRFFPAVDPLSPGRFWLAKCLGSAVKPAAEEAAFWHGDLECCNPCHGSGTGALWVPQKISRAGKPGPHPIVKLVFWELSHIIWGFPNHKMVGLEWKIPFKWMI